MRITVERALGIAAVGVLVAAPVLFSTYFVSAILTQTLWLGIAAASVVFLSAYGGMVSLAQVAIYGIAGMALGNMVAAGGSKGLNLGWNPYLSVVVAIAIAVVAGAVFGAIASRSTGIYFLMITLVYSVIVYYFFGQVTQFSGFGGVQINRFPSALGSPTDHPFRLFYVALVAAALVYALIRYVVTTPFGTALQGIRDEPVRMASLGFNVPVHRTLAFTFAAFVAALAGILSAWWDGLVAPSSIDLNQTLNVLVVAVIGGLLRIEGAWIGAFAFALIDNYLQGIAVLGDRFRMVVGLVFLVIVLVSPDGIMGAWDRLRGSLRRPGGPENPVAEQLTGPGG